MTAVKLCGLTKERDILVANRLKPEYIGFVFWKKSRRYVEPEQAQKLKARLDRDIKAVGVFVDAPHRAGGRTVFPKDYRYGPVTRK